jgi:hypothetical protein
LIGGERVRGIAGDAAEDDLNAVERCGVRAAGRDGKLKPKSQRGSVDDQRRARIDRAHGHRDVLEESAIACRVKPSETKLFGDERRCPHRSGCSRAAALHRIVRERRQDELHVFRCHLRRRRVKWKRDAQHEGRTSESIE